MNVFKTISSLDHSTKSSVASILEGIDLAAADLEVFSLDFIRIVEENLVVATTVRVDFPYCSLELIVSIAKEEEFRSFQVLLPIHSFLALCSS